jgi:protein-S-isoprenylcysteine O-methyltransferase Ste14
MSRAAIYTVVFFFLAPGTTAGLVPWLITGWEDPTGFVGWALVAIGLVVVVACFTRFVREGAGTPAPTEPTERLVVGGIYRYVRNPMYLAVASMIGGQALLFRDWEVVVWLGVFMLAVFAFVRGYEEPTLAAQYGAEYDAYRAGVPGWWPRLTPWRG